MNNPNRRDFLQVLGWAGLGLAAPCVWPEVSIADATQEPYAGPYYIVFNASGGWDTTYLMDPKGKNGMNRLYEEGDILTHGNHTYAPTAKHKAGGLSNEDFYAEFGDELLVLNGLDYSVNNHSPGARYMATGKLDSLAYPTFAALVAACKGPTCPLAFLTFGNYSATGNVVAMSRVPYIASLQKIANADAVEGNERSPYHDRFALDRIEQALEATYQARVEESNLPRLERAQNMLYAAQVNSKALQRVTPHIPKTMPKERLSQQVDIALSSFKAGVCVSANLSIGQFDSHANNDPDQMKLIPEFLAGVAYLMHRAEELKIREQIVVIIQSEMGRTPNYNAGNGKDHWSIGSVMFLGHGIKGNRVLGATDDKLFQVSINPHSLTLDAESGIRVRPEHIHHALREHADIVEHPFCKRFPIEIPEDDKLQGLWG